MTAYKLRFSPSAKATLDAMENGGTNELAKLRKVRRTLAWLEKDPRHRGLNSHQYESFPVDKDVKVWDSYVENRTPSAWRIFWRYGPNEPGSPLPIITVLAIGPHP